MPQMYKPRSWRQCLADNYEREHGPLDDPVPTFGAKLVTAPYTPALPFDIAGPDIEFMEDLDRRLNLLGSEPIPKCLQGLRFIDPDEEEDYEVIFSDSDSESDSDNEDSAPWSLCEFAERMFKKAGIDVEAVVAKRRAERRARKRQTEVDQEGSIHDNEGFSRKSGSDDKGSEAPSSRDYAIKLFNKAGVDIEAVAAERQAEHLKRKRQAEDEEDTIQDAQACKRTRHEAATSRPKRQIRPPQKPQASYSPPQTPSPTAREHTQGQPGSTSSCEPLVAQQPTPEVDNSPSHLKLGKSQDSSTVTSTGPLPAG